jgi:hypothetical protein
MRPRRRQELSPPRRRRSSSAARVEAMEGPPAPVALHDLLRARCSTAFSPRAPALPHAVVGPLLRRVSRARRLSLCSIWSVEEAHALDCRSGDAPRDMLARLPTAESEGAPSRRGERQQQHPREA